MCSGAGICGRVCVCVFLCSFDRDTKIIVLWCCTSIILIRQSCVCVCVCVTAVFRCFHIEKSPIRPVSFAQ